jgi:glycosyltransferase involved in cell wall biosynthesis
MSDAPGAPLVSVMLPAYNAGNYLAEAIDSVLAQTHRPLELIVVDDGSEDDTADIARGYGDRITFLQQQRQGNGGARNTAVAHAQGEYLAFLDADDRFPPERLERELRALQAEPELEAVFGHVREFVTPNLDPEVRALMRPPREDAAWISPTLMLIRREALFRVGMFDIALNVGATVDWCVRALDAGLRYRMLPEIVLERRLHGANNGIREAHTRSDYAHVLKASLDRRRRGAQT